jgi:hypothetical protein
VYGDIKRAYYKTKAMVKEFIFISKMADYEKTNKYVDLCERSGRKRLNLRNLLITITLKTKKTRGILHPVMGMRVPARSRSWKHEGLYKGNQI